VLADEPVVTFEICQNDSHENAPAPCPGHEKRHAAAPVGAAAGQAAARREQRKTEWSYAGGARGVDWSSGGGGTSAGSGCGVGMMQTAGTSAVAGSRVVVDSREGSTLLRSSAASSAGAPSSIVREVGDLTVRRPRGGARWVR